MVFGIKVSKPGINVGTVVDSKNLVFDSTLNQLKVKGIIEGDFTKSGSGTETFTVAHTLGYIPGYLPFVKVSGRWYGNVGEDPTSGLRWNTRCDASNISLICNSADGEDIKFKAFVLIDEGTEIVSSTTTADAVGIKVSDVGKGVGTATDQDLSLSTLFETLQVIEVKSINNTASVGEITSAHGLSYTPAWMANFVDNNANGKTLLAPFLLVGSRELSVWSDGNDIGVRNESIAPEDLTYKVAVLTLKLE